LVSDIKGGIYTESVWEQGAEVYIWTKEGRNNMKLEITAQ
jgi:hypothetical protein